MALWIETAKLILATDVKSGRQTIQQTIIYTATDGMKQNTRKGKKARLKSHGSKSPN